MSLALSRGERCCATSSWILSVTSLRCRLWREGPLPGWSGWRYAAQWMCRPRDSTAWASPSRYPTHRRNHSNIRSNDATVVHRDTECGFFRSVVQGRRRCPRSLLGSARSLNPPPCRETTGLTGSGGGRQPIGSRARHERGHRNDRSNRSRKSTRSSSRSD